MIVGGKGGGCGALVSTLVELLQHGGVGSLKHPLLAGGGRIARVHEDPPLLRVAVYAAVTDRMIQTLVLQRQERTGEDARHERLQSGDGHRSVVGFAYLPVAPELVSLHAVAVVESHRAVVGDGVKADLLGVHGITNPNVFSPAEGEHLRRGER